MYQSIPAVNIPRADPRGIFLGGEIPTPGAKKAAKPRPPGQKFTCEKALKNHPPGQNKTEEIN